MERTLTLKNSIIINNAHKTTNEQTKQSRCKSYSKASESVDLWNFQ